MSTEKQTKDLNNPALNKIQVERISTKIRCAIDEIHKEAKANLEWLLKSMNSYFFAVMEDEPEALSTLVTNLSYISKNEVLMLADREDRLIVARLNQVSSFCDTLERLKDRNISYSYTSSSYLPLPRIKNELEIQRFEFDSKSNLEVAGTHTESIPEVVTKPIKESLRKEHPNFELDKFDQVLKLFGANNAGYVQIDSPRRIARFFWLYQQTVNNGDIYFDIEQITAMGNKKETRILFGVGNPPQRQFILQIINIFKRLNIHVSRSTCIGVNNGQFPYFLGAFCVNTETGGIIEKGTKIYDLIKDEIFNTLILAPTSASYIKLLLPGLINGIDCSLIEILIGFCHANLAHNQQSRFGLQDVIRAYHTHLDISLQLIKLLKNRFDPVLKNREIQYQTLLDETISIVRNFSTGRRFLDELRKEIFECGLSFIRHTLRTNFFITDKLALAFRLDPIYLNELNTNITQNLPVDRPYRITYFHSELGMGFHIGFSDIARGGWRTIITKGQDDYETNASTVFKDTYLQAQIQHLKNKDIYAGGSKMLTILNVGDEYNFENINKFLYEIQFGFINALLDIYLTENGKPKNPLIVDYYQKDEAIELGPDENMHDVMIERIANVAEKRGYSLGAGIISSKKTGINHKEFGVTALGVVKFADLTMQELGINIQKNPFTVKFTGGPNGDVAGNAMSQLLDLCPFVMINMILDETGVFYDPLGADKKELRRILLKEDLEGFDPKALHRGGYILYRQKTKMDGMRQVFKKVVCGHTGLKEYWVSSDEFYHEFDHVIFKVSADLFIPTNGRPETIDVKNFHRFFNEDGSLLNRAIVEATNLFISPSAKIELQKKGMIIISDTSASKCSVIASAYEIIANLLLSEKELLSIKERYVSQVIAILKKRAEEEASLIFDRYKKAQGSLLYSEISDAVSTEINNHYATSYDFFRHNPSYCDKPLYQKAILSHLPEILKNNETFCKRIDSLPQKYKAAILASEIAAFIVYRGDNKASFIHMVEGHLSQI